MSQQVLIYVLVWQKNRVKPVFSTLVALRAVENVKLSLAYMHSNIIVAIEEHRRAGSVGTVLKKSWLKNANRSIYSK